MAHLQTPAGPWTGPFELLPDSPAVRLAVGIDAAGSPNWVEWHAGGKYSRLLVACPPWRGEQKTLFALKVQQDGYSTLAADPYGVDLNNASIDRAWLREIEAHHAAPEALMPCIAATSDSRSLPATTYCHTRGVFFRTFCPDSLEPLRTCRNDVLLSDFGLERYSTSLIRYAMGAISGQPARVYTWSRDGGRRVSPGITVRRRSELYRDYASLWQRDLSAADRSKLERDFPCWTCPHRETCYTPGTDARMVAEDRLSPLNYHEAHALLIEGPDVPFDALGAVLGGAPAVPLLQKHFASPPQSDRRTVIDGALDGPRAWLTPGASAANPGPAIAAQLAREAAALKLRAFEQVCQSLRLFHGKVGRPHLDLSPQHALARFHVAPGAAMPARWTATVRLLGVDLLPEVLPDNEAIANAAPALFVPPPTADALHRSPFLDAGTFRGTAQGTLRVNSAANQLIDCEFLATSARFQNVHPGDLVRLLPGRELPGTADRSLVGRVTEVQAGRLHAIVGTDPAHTPPAVQLPCEVPAELVTFHYYGTACDLWGLGMLLARLLLENDGRDMFGTDDLVRGLTTKFEQSAATVQGSVEELARNLLAQQKEIASAAVLHDQRLRSLLLKAPLPKQLWSDLWVFTLRLTSRTPRFSFATAHGQRAPMDEICERVAELAQRLDVEAFGTDSRQQELSQALARHLQQSAPRAP